MANEFEAGLVESVRRGPGDGDEQQSVVVDIRGEKIEFFYPGSGQMAYMAMASAGDRNDIQTAGMMINFVVSLMDDKDARWLRGLLLNREEEFGIEDILTIFDDLMEEWSSRPTKSPSDYLPPQQTRGQRSTATSRRAGSTRGGSR